MANPTGINQYTKGGGKRIVAKISLQSMRGAIKAHGNSRKQDMVTATPSGLGKAARYVKRAPGKTPKGQWPKTVSGFATILANPLKK